MFRLHRAAADVHGRRGGNATGLARQVLGGWQIGGILNARSGLPVDVRITRPDVVYVDGLGNVFANPAADRTAMINTPGGGNSRNVRRPAMYCHATVPARPVSTEITMRAQMLTMPARVRVARVICGLRRQPQ